MTLHGFTPGIAMGSSTMQLAARIEEAIIDAAELVEIIDLDVRVRKWTLPSGKSPPLPQSTGPRYPPRRGRTMKLHKMTWKATRAGEP